jgi:hypothetical protein
MLVSAGTRRGLAPLAVLSGVAPVFAALLLLVRLQRAPLESVDLHTATWLNSLPRSAFPSGHRAATTCRYVAIAILVIGHARGWWRYLIWVIREFPVSEFPISNVDCLDGM